MALALRVISSGIRGTAGRNTFNVLRNPCLLRSSICNNIRTQVQRQPARMISLSSPKFAGASSQHTALWTAERFLSAGLLGIIPAALIFPSQGLDALLAISIVMHQHWGLEAIVTDYVRPILFGNVVPKVAHGALLLFSIATLGGLLYFIYNDIGISKAIRKLWAIKGQ